MSTFNIFNMASGEELGRYFARTAAEALNAMAKVAGYDSYDAARALLPAMEAELLITEL